MTARFPNPMQPPVKAKLERDLGKALREAEQRGEEIFALILSREDMTILHRKIAGEALHLCGRAMHGTASPDEVREKDRMVHIAGELAHALDRGGRP
ncbi:hypothetical protein SAMN02927924_01357 [Sphingobium faniae]|nr:hypothetical protein SAMN02927924_01357 [Sphingobium faniae]